MTNKKPIDRIRGFVRNKPVIGGLLVVILHHIAAHFIGEAMIAMPDKTYVYYLQEILFIGCALIFVLICGYGHVYREGSFWKTLKAAMPIFVLQGLLAVFTVAEAFNNPAGPWKEPLFIIVGLLSLFKIGFCEESIFRGIIANAIGGKYCTDHKGVWKAAVLSGAIFGAVHMANCFAGVAITSALIQSVMAAMLGMFFAAAYFRGGNIWTLMLIHALTDFNSLFSSLFTEAGTQVDAMNELSPVSFVMIPVFIALTAYLLRKKKLDEILTRFHHEKAFNS